VYLTTQLGGQISFTLYLFEYNIYKLKFTLNLKQDVGNAIGHASGYSIQNIR